MYIKSGASAQEESKRERPRRLSKDGIQFAVNVGDHKKCPECQTIGRVVWISQDKKTMGVQCPSNHKEAWRPVHRYGGAVVGSTKNRRNMVFLMDLG